MSPVEPSSINSQHDANMPLPRTAEGPHDFEDHLRGLKQGC